MWTKGQKRHPVVTTPLSLVWTVSRVSSRESPRSRLTCGAHPEEKNTPKICVGDLVVAGKGGLWSQRLKSNNSAATFRRRAPQSLKSDGSIAFSQHVFCLPKTLPTEGGTCTAVAVEHSLTPPRESESCLLGNTGYNPTSILLTSEMYTAHFEQK